MIVDLKLYAEQRKHSQSRVSRQSIIKNSIRKPLVVEAETFDTILAQLERYKEDQHGVTEKQERILSGMPAQAQI